MMTGVVKVLMTQELLDALCTRTAAGDQLTYHVQPARGDEEGCHELVITRHPDENPARAAVDAYVELLELLLSKPDPSRPVLTDKVADAEAIRRARASFHNRMSELHTMVHGDLQAMPMMALAASKDFDGDERFGEVPGA